MTTTITVQTSDHGATVELQDKDGEGQVKLASRHIVPPHSTKQVYIFTDRRAIVEEDK